MITSQSTSATTFDWRRALLVSFLGFLVAAATGVLFALFLQSTGDWRSGLDWERALMLRIDRTVPIAFDWMMLALPWLGTNLTLVPIIAIFAIWVVRTRGRIDLAMHLSIVVIGSLLLNAMLKAWFDRPRPQLWEHRGQYQWAAYPSGHAIVGASVIYTFAYLLYRERGWRWPFVVASVFLLINVYSRVYLGVHWPTDVIGGLLIGVVWLATTLYAFRRGNPAPAQAEERPLAGAPRTSSGTPSPRHR